MDSNVGDPKVNPIGDLNAEEEEPPLARGDGGGREEVKPSMKRKAQWNDKLAEIIELLPRMAADVPYANPPTYVLLHEIKQGALATIKVMICRKWDVNSRFGKHLSSDFIVSDEKGDIFHCTAEKSVAHCFMNKLCEGAIYYIKNFKIKPNAKQYRVLKDKDHMIQLEGSTIVRKANGETTGFTRYPFQIVEFEGLQESSSKYLVDVIGVVGSVGKQYQKQSDDPNSKTLDLRIINTRGETKRTTLWGSLGDAFLKQWGKSNTYALILTSMNVKSYKGELCLSSSSSTILVDDDCIPLLKQFKDEIKDIELKVDSQSQEYVPIKEASISELMDWGRDKKNDVQTFKCKADVTNIRTQSGWYYLSCASGKCKKGVTRRDGQFYCESCEQIVEHPKARFKLQLEVRDDSGHVIFVIFDDAAEKIVKTSAQTLLAENSEVEDNDSVLPQAVSKLINSAVTFKIRSNTHYQHSQYEGFTCNKIEASPKAPTGFKKKINDGVSEVQLNQIKRQRINIPATPEPSPKKKNKHAADESEPSE